MRMRIWNAFASNNSGSYIIVGSFPSEAIAGEAAAELLAAVKAHTCWLRLAAPETTDPAPLETLAKKYGLDWERDAPDDGWPEHSSQEHPSVWALGHQVFVHSDYTVTMPRVLGHFIYAKGGRVQTELDHAHHPIVAVFEIWFPWATRNEADIPARVQDIVDALCSADGPFVRFTKAGNNPAWKANPGSGEADLVVGVVFDDLCAGFCAVSDIVVRQGAGLRSRLFEAWSSEADPLGFLRPCSPPTH